jgi:rod shape-determining protein MreC
LSLVLMVYDQRSQWTVRIRYALMAAAYPVQVAVSSPGAGWRWVTETFRGRAVLEAENAALRQRLRELELAALRAAALEHENAELRGLTAGLPPLIKQWTIAEIVSVDTNSLRQRLVLDKGGRDGVKANQAVVDANGIVGQVARVGPWSSEVILVTDPEHALPVQITRNGLRSIAVGSGDSGELLLPYLAVNSDVKGGDLLVSSGLGGVYPAGLPVARITGVKREPNQLTASVRAQPLATLDRDREVLLLSFDDTHPAAPAPNPPIAPAPAPPKAAVPAPKLDE